MPKKSRRAAARYAAMSKRSKKKRPSIEATYQPSPVPASEASDTEILPAAPSVHIPSSEPTRPRPVARQIAPEYRYLIGDLRRVGIIAGAMIAILILLTFLFTFLLH